MKRRTLLLVTALALATLAAVPFLHAEPRHGRDGEFLLARLARAREALGLTDPQVDALKAIARDLREENAPYREQLRGGFHQVAQTLIANPDDVAAAQALLDRQAAAERTMKSNLLTAVSKALNVLTPDQRAKVAQFLQERKGRHR